jgi:hypothetical protein
MVPAAYILIAVGGVTALVGFIIILMVAFRVSVGWGLVVLFLWWLVIPLVVFLVKYWTEARAGFLLCISGWIVSGVGSFVLAGSETTTAVAEFERYDPQPRLAQPDLSEAEGAPVASDDLSEGEYDLPQQMPTPVAEPTPTPPPPETSPDTEELEEVIPTDQAADHIGEYVELSLQEGRRVRVFIESAGPDGLRVTQRVGGGTVTYPVRWDSIIEIHRLP